MQRNLPFRVLTLLLWTLMEGAVVALGAPSVGPSANLQSKSRAHDAGLPIRPRVLTHTVPRRNLKDADDSRRDTSGLYRRDGRRDVVRRDDTRDTFRDTRRDYNDAPRDRMYGRDYVRQDSTYEAGYAHGMKDYNGAAYDQSGHDSVRRDSPSHAYARTKQDGVVSRDRFGQDTVRRDVYRAHDYVRRDYGASSDRYGQDTVKRDSYYPRRDSGATPEPVPEPTPEPVPAPIFEGEDCVATPADYVAAFLNRENRCVDKNILVRLQSDNGKGGAAMARDMFAARLKARPVTFFSYGETPAKYLRDGAPLYIGDMNEKPGRGGDADAGFDGLDGLSSFLGMLQQIGYDAPSSYITGTYAMIVTYRPEKNSFIPTWKNVISYFSSYLAWVAEDPSFTLEAEIADKLSGKTFGNLTGCPTTCTFEDLEFPQSPRPATIGKRISPTECQNPNTTRYVLSEPTGFDDSDASCGQLWKDAKGFADGFCTNGSDSSVIKNFTANLVHKLKGLSDVEEKAMYLRAYFNTPCGGTFNSLFSGNGFTYTAHGGLMSPTGTEMLVGAAPHDNKDNCISNFSDIQYIYFCSDGQVSQDPDFKCPTST